MYNDHNIKYVNTDDEMSNISTLGTFGQSCILESDFYEIAQAHRFEKVKYVYPANELDPSYANGHAISIEVSSYSFNTKAHGDVYVWLRTGTRHLRLVYRGRRVILEKEFYPRREIPIRRAKRNEYGYLHPFVPDETRTHESREDFYVLERAGDRWCAREVRVGLTCIKIHRTGKIYFPVPGELKIDPTARPDICYTQLTLINVIPEIAFHDKIN